MNPVREMVARRLEKRYEGKDGINLHELCHDAANDAFDTIMGRIEEISKSDSDGNVTILMKELDRIKEELSQNG